MNVMKKLIIVIIVFVGTMSVYAERPIVRKVLGLKKDDTEQVRHETKFDKFNSRKGGFIRYIDYEIPGLKTSEALIESAKIRRYMDIHTDESTFFVIISVGHERQEEAIAYEDFLKVLDAIKTLWTKCEKDKIDGLSVKCYYVTDDGFRIGYKVKEGKSSWFFTVRGIERKFSKDFDFEAALTEAKNKIESFRK